MNIILILLVLQLNCHWNPSPRCHGHAVVRSIDSGGQYIVLMLAYVFQKLEPAAKISTPGSSNTSKYTLGTAYNLLYVPLLDILDTRLAQIGEMSGVVSTDLLQYQRSVLDNHVIWAIACSFTALSFGICSS